MAFEPDFIEKVRESSNIVDEISKYTELKRAGDRYTGLCPFPDHHEKTPSFSVSESKQVYYCFGCKKAGNIYNFLQTLRGFSFPESVEYLAKKAGIAIPEQSHFKKNENQEKKNKKQWMYRVNAFASEFFHKYLRSLAANDPRVQYLAKRGLSPETIKTFKIGIAPDSWDSLLIEMQKNQVPLKLANEIGLIKQKEKGGFYDIYRNRLMFPIYSHMGDCIGFGGRTLGDDKAKYINSPDSEIFHKGNILYGLNETAKFIRTTDQVILVEGYMDFMALYSAGIKNVVAVLGTALTPQHAKLIKRYTKNIVVLFDGDASGKLAAERSLPILLSEDLLPKIVVVPQGQDPDDYIRNHGNESFLDLLQTARDLLLFIFHDQFKGYTGQPTEKVQILQTISPSLKLISDKSLLRLYVEEIADTLRQKPSWVYEFLQTHQAQASVSKSPKKLTQVSHKSVIENKGLIDLSRVPNAELYLVNLALMREKFLSQLTDEEVLKQFSSQEVRSLLNKLQGSYRQKTNDFDKLTALMANEVVPSSSITQHLDRSWSQMDEVALEKFFNDCLKKVQEAHLKNLQKSLKEKMRSSDASQRQQHLEQFMNIQKTRQALNNTKDSN
ncbi:MAG: DNA primase [Bdellovibrionales bacterium]|nr:DNA primase [Bdellovibrionales bacterium]